MYIRYKKLNNFLANHYCGSNAGWFNDLRYNSASQYSLRTYTIEVKNRGHCWKYCRKMTIKQPFNNFNLPF
jgi:hypothetical protein